MDANAQYTPMKRETETTNAMANGVRMKMNGATEGKSRPTEIRLENEKLV